VKEVYPGRMLYQEIDPVLADLTSTTGKSAAGASTAGKDK